MVPKLRGSNLLHFLHFTFWIKLNLEQQIAQRCYLIKFNSLKLFQTRRGQESIQQLTGEGVVQHGPVCHRATLTAINICGKFPISYI